MLAISETSKAALQGQAERTFAIEMAKWVHEQPELQEHRARATPQWCQETLKIADPYAIESEDDVTRFARLRLLRGDSWLQSPQAVEILHSSRTGQLQVFQLECLHWGIES